jgi:hypothetical protein
MIVANRFRTFGLRLALYARGGPVALAIAAVNIVHMVLHGTPLDSGMLDQTIAQVDAWLWSIR